MRRYIVPLILLAGGFLLVPALNDRQRQADPHSVHPREEIAMKQQILQNDVHVTDELCRRQCLYQFRQLAEQLKLFQPDRIEQALAEEQARRPHMQQFIWTVRSEEQKGNDLIVGKLEGQLHRQTQKYLLEAKNKTMTGKNYFSPTINSGGESYFVLGVPVEDGKSSLIGVIHQKILRQVSDLQTKNLRIVPYPSDKRWKIESVDSGTLRDVKVKHPEHNEGTSHYHKNEVVVKFSRHPSEAELKQIQREIGATMTQKLDHTYVFRSRHMETKQLIDYFRKWDIVYAEPHYLYLTNRAIPGIPAQDKETISPMESGDVGREAEMIEPNDVLYGRYQWNLPIIATDRGWTISTGASDIPVGVVDTGADFNHPDLAPHLWQGYNVVDTTSSPADDVGHGTHVAGVVAALVNNYQGVAGMTWANPVIPVKVLDETGAGSTYAVAQGIIWATDNGAKVINLSLGNYAEANFLHEAIKYAFDHDVVLVAASGNDSTEQPGYPAAYPEVLAVAATDASKNLASFSNFGEYIDVTAPGVNIPSTYPGNQYAAMSGTSMASPHVAALAALIRSVNPTLKNTEVMDIIRNTAEDLGPKGKDKYFGYGQIDVLKALESAANSRNMLSFWPRRLLLEYEKIKRKYEKTA